MTIAPENIRELTEEEREFLFGPSPLASSYRIPTGLTADAGAVYLHITHYHGVTLVEAEGEASNSEPWAHTGFFTPDEVLAAYLAEMAYEDPA
jgi:hypothetical protein